MVAAGSGSVYISPDSGITWVKQTIPHQTGEISDWNTATVAISANGQKVLAAGYTSAHDVFPGSLYASSDGGDTWRRLDAPTDYWTSIASSADGKRLVAASFMVQHPSEPVGPICCIPWFFPAASAETEDSGSRGGALYVSSDSGATWIKTDLPEHDWAKVASSSSGRKLVAVAAGGAVYRSLDGGGSWFAASPVGVISPLLWTSVAVSKDETRIAAASSNNGIWLSGPIAESPIQISGTGGNVILHSEASFANSVLLQSMDIESGLWSVINRDSTSSGDPNSMVILPAANRQFFRLIQP
jgi:photosystem II stability/assembly factor-like uncharacterized protein